MVSVEVNLLCDGKVEHGHSCSEILVSQSHATYQEAFQDVVIAATEQGWKYINGDWLCAECVDKIKAAC